jgi:predicted metal-binding protein
MNEKKIIEDYVKKLNISSFKLIPSSLIVPEQRIRDYCYENKCGCFNKHLTCPPYSGTVDEIKKKLKNFKNGVLIQYTENINVRNDNEGIKRTKIKLHNIVLEIEEYLKEKVRIENVWGMIGGNCALCDECACWF